MTEKENNNPRKFAGLLNLRDQRENETPELYFPHDAFSRFALWSATTSFFAWFNLASPWLPGALFLSIAAIVLGVFGIRNTLWQKQAGLSFAIIGMLLGLSQVIFRVFSMQFGWDFSAQGSKGSGSYSSGVLGDLMDSREVTDQIIATAIWIPFLVLLIFFSVQALRTIAKKSGSAVVYMLCGGVYVVLFLLIFMAIFYDEIEPYFNLFYLLT
ncbi:MAG: hypothetical protein Q8Q20_03995 [bacterium]|nr:hypothetical protein [bacterium]